MIERDVKHAVKKYLESIGAYYFMPVQTGYGAACVDFVVCHKGRFYGIETKRPGRVNGVSSRQAAIMRNIIAAGGLVCVEASVGCESVKELMRDNVL